MAAVTTVHTLCSNSNNNKGSEKVNAETVNYYNTKHTHTDALSLSLSLTHTPTERHLNIAGVTAPVTATVAVVAAIAAVATVAVSRRFCCGHKQGHVRN